jgi:hypothetical protein
MRCASGSTEPFPGSWRPRSLKRRLRTIGAIVLAAAGSASAHAAKELPVPDWAVQAASAMTLKPAWQDAKAVVLLEDTLVTVDAGGRATQRYRIAVKILRPQGREYAKPFASFYGDAKLHSFHVWSIGPDGHHYSMKDSEYTEVGLGGESVLYQDERARIASPPAADPGAVVAWEYEEQLPSYFREDTWSFQNEIPTLRSVYEIDLPAGWHQEAVWSRHSALAAAETAPGHFRWEQANIDGIDLTDVPLAPSWAAIAGHMTVHFAADPLPHGDALWARIGNWYTSLAAPRSEGAADLARTAKSVAGDGDFMTRLTGVATFMQQQIRYVAIEIGIGGWQPHSAEDVFRSRYGDCKDKATLMVAMLDAAGIRATWVSVDVRRGRIDPQAPSLFGDHMITAIVLPQGVADPRLQAVITAKNGRRYLIFDPTNEFVPVGQIPSYEQGGWGLLTAGPDSQVVQLPVLPPAADTVDRKATFDLSADGTLKGDITVLRYGALSGSMRHRLAMDSEKEQRDRVERILQNDFSTFTLGSEKIAHVHDLNQPLEMDYAITAPSYARNAGALLLVRPRAVGTDADRIEGKPRTVPISFEGVGTWRDDFDFRLPPGYAVDDLPDPVNLDVGFASYRSEVKAEAGQLHYKREYVLKKVELDATDYPKLRELEAAIATDENSSAVLKKQ